MFYGVDVGQAGDHAAEAVVAPAGPRPGGGPRPVWRLVGAARIDPGPYADLARHVAWRRSSLTSQTGRQVFTVVDATGCGRPVVEMIRDRCRPEGASPVLGATFTAGSRPGGAWPDITVPKRLMVEHVQVALETGGLVVDGSPGAEALVDEMGRMVDRGGRVGAVSGHDDLVCALMLAVYLGDVVAEQVSRREGIGHESVLG